MTDRKTNGKQPKPERRGVYSFLILALNAVLFFCALFLSSRYVSAYQERLREENLGNIKNLNQSAASNATALIESWNIKVNDLSQYLQRHPLTAKETLVLLEDANSSGDRLFELIDSEYAGYQARRGADGGFVPVSYARDAYAELKKAFDDTTDAGSGSICFAPEFTESGTALKYCAVYRHVPLLDETASAKCIRSCWPASPRTCWRRSTTRMITRGSPPC